MINRVEITDKAADVVARLNEQHGALMFHQSGGCCDGSAPMCYPAGDFRVGPQDVLLGSSNTGSTPSSSSTSCPGAVPGFRWKRRRVSGS
jgi:uncharacterized protein (DUF779 family)